MPVNTKHKKHCEYEKRWKLVRSIVDNAASYYIRTVDVNDKLRSDQYRADAVLTNFTRLTKDGLTGLVFRKAPTVRLPDKLNYLMEDATGEGVSLNAFSQKLIGEVLQTGRFGVLVDYPPVDGVVSAKEQESGYQVARLKPYCAEAIINYKLREFGNKCKLSLVTLYEQVEDPSNEDMFDLPLVDRYRVLYLDENGLYAQCLYDENLEMVETPTYPTKYDGSYWEEIPFQFFGSENNDPEYDPIPLYDLAIVNLGHYRNSADYEESIFICGQPMGVWAIGGSPEQFEAANPGGILWGSRRGVNVGENGSGQLLQANANQLADTAMQRKEIQAAAIGARLIAPAGGRETAEAARIRYGSQNSALYTLTNNSSNGIEQLLAWVCDYMHPEGEFFFQLNDVFYDDATDPQMLMAMLQCNDRGAVSVTEIRNYIRETGGNAFLDETDAKAETAAHQLVQSNSLPI